MSSSRKGKINTVAILGAGPAASTLAILLARSGLRVAMFHRPKQAPLIVGESLVPAIIPMLQEIGVEDEVRSYSTLKPGATFNLSDDVNFTFFFNQLTGRTARYAYNVPRIASMKRSSRQRNAKVRRCSRCRRVWSVSLVLSECISMPTR